MSIYDAHWLWYDFANIAGSAVMRSQNVDSDDPHIDWERQKQAVRIAGLSFACSLLETLELKGADNHIKTLFHLRNAVLHNSRDIKENIGHPNPYNHCTEYLNNETWREIYPVDKERENVHFTLNNDGIVIIETSIFRFVEKLLYSYLTEAEKSTPPQKIR